MPNALPLVPLTPATSNRINSVILGRVLSAENGFAGTTKLNTWLDEARQVLRKMSTYAGTVLEIAPKYRRDRS
jgi:hypothetical protein